MVDDHGHGHGHGHLPFADGEVYEDLDATEIGADRAGFRPNRHVITAKALDSVRISCSKESDSNVDRDFIIMLLTQYLHSQRSPIGVFVIDAKVQVDIDGIRWDVALRRMFSSCFYGKNRLWAKA